MVMTVLWIKEKKLGEFGQSEKILRVCGDERDFRVERYYRRQATLGQIFREI
jgi:hypothetical protein